MSNNAVEKGEKRKMSGWREWDNIHEEKKQVRRKERKTENKIHKERWTNMKKDEKERRRMKSKNNKDIKQEDKLCHKKIKRIKQNKCKYL